MVEDDRFNDFSNKLDEDGFFIWCGLFNRADIDTHLQAYESVAPQIDAHYLKDKTPAALPAHRAARGKFIEEDKTHEALCFNSQLVGFLQMRFGTEPVLRSVGTHLYTVGSHLHADCLNTAATDPWEHELRIWAALEDVNPSAGPLYVYPKSHRLISGSIRETMLNEQPGYHDWLINDNKPYTDKAKAFNQHMIQKIEAGIKSFNISRVIPSLKKGDAVIFSPAIIHGTEKAGDPALTRKCMIFNHYASGTPFYVPSAYWGATHDYRRPENEVHFDVERTSAGLRVVRYLETYEEISKRRVVTALN